MKLKLKPHHVVLCLCISILSLMLMPHYVCASFTTHIDRITKDDNSDLRPQIYDKYVVWYGSDGNDEEIFLYNIETALTFQITDIDNEGNDRDPYINGTKIVWSGTPIKGGRPAIFYYDIALGGEPVRVSNNSFPINSEPWIDGNYIVWKAGSEQTGAEIYLYNIFTKTVSTNISNNVFDDQHPIIHGNLVVWEGSDGHDTEIFVYNIETGERRQLTHNDVNDFTPKVYNGLIVWHGGKDSETDIYIYDYKLDNLLQLTDDNIEDKNPQIHANYIVWERYIGKNMNSEIYLYKYPDFRSSIKRLTDNEIDDHDPQVYNGKVVWSNHKKNSEDSDHELYLYTGDINNIIQITSSGQHDHYPKIYKDTIVWEAGYSEKDPIKDPSLTEIYMATIIEVDDDKVAAAEPPISTSQGSSSPVKGGCSIVGATAVNDFNLYHIASNLIFIIIPLIVLTAIKFSTINHHN